MVSGAVAASCSTSQPNGLAELLDILRNEPPLAPWFDSSESLAGLTTLTPEQVGKGDVVRMAAGEERAR